jgi:hypothetical protein
VFRRATCSTAGLCAGKRSDYVTMHTGKNGRIFRCVRRVFYNLDPKDLVPRRLAAVGYKLKWPSDEAFFRRFFDRNASAGASVGIPTWWNISSRSTTANGAPLQRLRAAGSAQPGVDLCHYRASNLFRTPYHRSRRATISYASLSNEKRCRRKCVLHSGTREKRSDFFMPPDE